MKFPNKPEKIKLIRKVKIKPLIGFSFNQSLIL
jgi:hypothetical protein